MRLGIAVPACGFAGGVERYAHDLALDLRRRGHHVELIHGRASARDPRRYAEAFDAVRTLGEPGVAADLDAVYVQRAEDVDELAAFGDTPLLLAAHDHDHTCARSHRYLPFSGAACHRAPGVGCLARGCVVIRRRDARLQLAPGRPLALGPRLARLAARAPIVACSQYVAERLHDAGADPARVHFVHPVPPEAAHDFVAAPPGGSLLAVGQLLRGKGFDLAIEAAGMLGVQLELAGDGPSRAELEQLAARLAPGRVRFHGYLSPAEVDRLYDRCALVLVPSRWPEPFGMVGIEAMRRGRAVVGARHGGIPEWLREGHGGLGFRPGDSRDLAAQARRLLDDPQAGERALAESRRFSRDDFVKRIEALLGRVAGGSHARDAA